jgi:hypothetical protein
MRNTDSTFPVLGTEFCELILLHLVVSKVSDEVKERPPRNTAKVQVPCEKLTKSSIEGYTSWYILAVPGGRLNFECVVGIVRPATGYEYRIHVFRPSFRIDDCDISRQVAAQVLNKY